MRKVPLTRADLEEREDANLAPYAMRAARSRGRAEFEPEDLRRTSFQRDRDRIVHSTAFRRLQYKTQVFVNDEGDHYRTRLTHSLEVAQIARTVARSLALNEELVEAGALAHDLGHTPFGHSGEDALAECLAAHGGFEHNRQSLRVVDLLERRGPHRERRGLNLTYEVRESIAKHERLQPGRMPHVEAQVVDTCDSLAYDAHDVDDGRRSGLISSEDLAALAIWRRTGSVARLIHLVVTDLVDATAARLAAERVDAPDAARTLGRYVVGFSPEVGEQKKELERFLHARLYRHPRVMRVRERASRIVRELYAAYVAEPDLMPAEWRAWAGEVGRERAVADYIAGMTDRFARLEWEKLGT